MAPINKIFWLPALRNFAVNILVYGRCKVSAAMRFNDGPYFHLSFFVAFGRNGGATGEMNNSLFIELNSVCLVEARYWSR